MKRPNQAFVIFSAGTVIFSIGSAPFTTSLCDPVDKAKDCLGQIQGVAITASSTSIASDITIVTNTPVVLAST